uniref:SAM domain-containing protein n=1 Tax=Hemiselmis andersenii TaxID=464988 RepID=A0A7S1MY34_HEMAN|mmetsp:Transcript_7358/g.17747  ORF Transcript_7358/g.17747 Transcript_7358/m.17747 type:complete len:1238 (+) Transcript_7358:230-3943(+)
MSAPATTGAMETEDQAPRVVRIIKSIVKNLLAKKSPMMDLFLFTILTLGLTAAGFTYQNVYQTRQLTLAYRRVLMDLDKITLPSGEEIGAHWNDLDTDTDVWDYLEHQLPRRLIRAQEYNGEALREEAKGKILRYHMVVMQFRLRQLRVSPQACRNTGERLGGNQAAELEAPYSGTYQVRGTRNLTCYPPYSRDAEQSTQRWHNQSWVSASVLGVKERLTKANPYRGGGYIQPLPSHDRALWQAEVARLRALKWTDEATRAVFLEFVTFCPPVDQFITVRLLFEYRVGGAVIPSLTVRAFRDLLPKPDGAPTSSTSAETLLYGIAMLNFLREGGKVFAGGLAAYVGGIWNVITFLALLMVSMSMYYRYLISGVWTEIDGLAYDWALEPTTGQWRFDYDWHGLGYNYAQLIKYQAIALVGSWLRVFGYLKFFSRRIDDFVSAMSYATTYLTFYILICSFTILGLSIAFHTGYGHDQKQFRSVGTSIVALMEIFFGNYNAGPLNLADGFMLSSLTVVATTLISLYTLALALSVLVWSHRQVTLGLVVRESQDPTRNVRDRLVVWFAWIVANPFSFIFGKNFVKRYIEKREVKTTEEELSEEEVEAERAVREANSWIFRAKTGLKTMIRAAAVLRSRIRTLENEYHVAITDNAPAYKTNNVWRKLRNHYQDAVFKQLVDMVRVGDTGGIVDSLFAWRKEDWGFDLEWRDNEGFTALHIAAFAGDPNSVKVLMEGKADVNGQNDDGNTPLHLAAMTGQINACRVLVEEGKCMVNPTNMYSFTPAHLAAYAGHRHVLKFLIDEAMADIHSQNDDGLTCLHCAVMTCNMPLVRYIATRWPSTLEQQAQGGETPLHAAIVTQQPNEMIRCLLQCGARVSTKNFEGANGHQISVDCEAPLSVQRLLFYVLRAGDDYNRAESTLDEGAAALALIRFAAAGRIEDMKKMFEAGCDVDGVQPGGGTALHMAVRKRKDAVIEALLAQGANPQVEDSEGRTPLMLAVEEGKHDEFLMLIAKVHPDDLPVDEDGNTLLHHAAMSGRSVRICKHLVHELRIFPFAPNYLGKSSADLAELGRVKVQEMVDNGFLELDVAKEADELFCTILDFFHDRESYEDDAMILQGKQIEQMMAAPGQVDDNQEAFGETVHQYSMKVRKFFEQLGFTKYGKEYAMLFKSNEIDWDGLPYVTDEQLKEMGIVVIGTRNKILAGIRRVVNKETRNAAKTGNYDDDVSLLARFARSCSPCAWRS